MPSSFTPLSRDHRPAQPGPNEAWTRVPPGHPEGYLEGFANLYSDIADQLQLRLSDNQTSGRPTDDVDAYRLFLRGRHHYQVRGEEDLPAPVENSPGGG